MTIKRVGRRRVLALTVTAGFVGAGCLGVVLAESAGAASLPTSAAQHQQSAHIVPMGSASASPVARATGSAAYSAASSAAGQTKLADPTKTAATSASHPAASSSSAVPATGGPSAGRAQQVQLAPAQLPALSAEKWAPVGSPSTRTIAGHDIGENECAKVDGADTWTQQAFSGGDGQNVAIQDTFVFGSASAAESAYQHLTSGMNACRQTTRALQTANKVAVDATVTETASRSDAAAWERGWTGVLGMSAAGPQTNHLYAAVDGTRLIVLQFTEFPGQAAAYDVSADPSVLSMLQTELAR
jgi:hypothetical protein